MQGIIALFKREPVLFLGATGLLGALLTCAAAFGLSLTPPEAAGIILVEDAIVLIVARSNVSPVSSAPPAPSAPPAS
jgi:hypothetical protein